MDEQKIALYREASKKANKAGDALKAFDAAVEGLKYCEEGDLDPGLLHAKALALARMGSTELAQEILSSIPDYGDHDLEIRGLVARTYKDVWLNTGNPADLKRSLDAYRAAYQAGAGWIGINVATLSLASGDKPAAHQAAREVLKSCHDQGEAANADDEYWRLATIAEAHLVLGEVDEAEGFYAKGGRIGKDLPGGLLTTWRNARIVLRFHPPAVFERIKKALALPSVAVFAGHRFPADAANLECIREAILDRLVKNDIRIGYSSAASGSDILFLEAIQSLGGQTHIVLPCNEEQFIEESVRSSGPEWEARYKAVKSKASDVILASGQRLQFGSIAYDYSNDVTHGLAAMRSMQLETKLLCLAVFDAQLGYRPGGTADIVTRWKNAEREIIVIDPNDPTQPGRIPVPGSSVEIGKPSAAFESEVRAMLFADAHHFSKIPEEGVPNFISHYLGPIAMLANDPKSKVLFKNTWGDGFFFVFENAKTAARFAKKLAQRDAGIDRKAFGLPEDLGLRIALHAGPVYKFKDEIADTKKDFNYIGGHVNRTARIEPITPIRRIYASYAFAALVELEAPDEFRFDYVGKIKLAKDFGELAVYDMRS